MTEEQEIADLEKYAEHLEARAGRLLAEAAVRRKKMATNQMTPHELQLAERISNVLCDLIPGWDTLDKWPGAVPIARSIVLRALRGHV